jgi:hypothetical protein
MASSKKPKKPTKKKKLKKPIRYSPPVSVYKKRLKEPPKGYELLEPSEDDVSQAKSKIKKLLDTVCEAVAFDCWVKVKDYPKAAEVDGWLVVYGVKGVDTKGIVQSIQEAMLPDVAPTDDKFGMSVLGKGYWISVGFHFQGTGSEDEVDQYKKWHGMVEVSSNYRSMSDTESTTKARSKILSAFSVGQLPSSRSPNSMIENIEAKFKNTIADIFVKVVWNARNAKPIRSEPEKEIGNDD